MKALKHPGDVLCITITYIVKEPHLPQTGCQQRVQPCLQAAFATSLKTLS